MNNIKTKGWDKLLAGLDSLPNLMVRKLVRDSFKTALAPMLDAVKAGAPVDTGALRDSVQIRVAKTRGTFVAVAVTVRGPGVARIEFGSDKSPPNPFVRNAADRKGQGVVDDACGLIVDGIFQSLKR